MKSPKGGRIGCRRDSRARMGGGDRLGGSIQLDPITAVRHAYARAVAPSDPSQAPSKPKTWADMTEAEREEMRRLYEKKP